MSVELITESSPALVRAMERLIPQLSRSAQPLDAEATARFVAQPSVHVFVFRSGEAPAPTSCADANERVEDDSRPILGMLSLATFEIPTGVRAWIEDVVVDSEARGQGAGQALVEAALAHAKSLGARTVDLTSRPSREAANRLYRRCGFEQRETNVYRVTLVK
ncbi:MULTISPECIES: GNAT family N-acetyltransferase [unclassified Schaalia]|uniref:GNAT family N-acetyltransferase n=1 Tax=unclassified Schaalia TaxID=2691889 RepID=UPI001E583651|nr:MULTISPECIES: GNAT family N-acetyltransferase [unclassified Schaalia]MCD4549994.1 GNAT family N-acetyltransferase [Schaalia sp. lx-260]MCD4557645.1 GNAT family N-acetyltransferase [Schaalia sp. lx-100]